MEGKNTKVYVDSVSSGICRLLAGEKARAFSLPLEFLPDGTQEGDVLHMVFALSPEEADSDREETERLLGSLGGGL